MEKPYAVVHFFEQNSYSEIPSNWLLNTDKSTGVSECKWPPSFIKNLHFYFKNRITPTDDWPIYKIKFMRYCDTLMQARKAAEESDNSASEQPLGKGHRSKFPSAAAAAATSKTTSTSADISSDEENNKANNGQNPAAEMPKINKEIKKKSLNVPTTYFSRSDKGRPINNDQSLGVQNSDGIVRNGDLPDPGGDDNNNTQAPKDREFSKKKTLSDEISDSSDSDNDVHDGDGGDGAKCYHTLNGKLDSCLRFLGTLAVDMKDLKQRIDAINDANNGEVMNEHQSKVKNDLPLNSREEVSAFNTKLLESKDYHQEFVKMVNQVGGANGKEYTERVLNTIFSTSFAAVNSWEGKKTKFKLSNLKLIKTCEEVILKKFTSWDSAEFSKAGTNWLFRLGNQRAGLQQKQKEKQKKREETRSEDAAE